MIHRRFSVRCYVDIRCGYCILRHVGGGKDGEVRGSQDRFVFSSGGTCDHAISLLQDAWHTYGRRLPVSSSLSVSSMDDPLGAVVAAVTWSQRRWGRDLAATTR